MERTFAIIKPDAVRKNYSANIIKMISDAGFAIKGMKMTRLSRDKASAFYAIHKEKFFFGELLDYMTSGPIVILALEAENAVEKYRALIGATDPEKADEGTIRKLYGESKTFNAVHGSDSPENGRLEIEMMFAYGETFFD